MKNEKVTSLVKKKKIKEPSDGNMHTLRTNARIMFSIMIAVNHKEHVLLSIHIPMERATSFSRILLITTI